MCPLMGIKETHMWIILKGLFWEQMQKMLIFVQFRKI